MAHSIPTDRPSYFPQFPELDPDTTYAAIIGKAKAEYEKYEVYSQTLKKIEESIKAWSEHPADQDFPQAVGLLAGYIDVETQIKDSISIYDDAIARCPIPFFDMSTLQVLQRSQINLQEIGRTVNQIFGEDLAQVNDQKKKMIDLSKKVHETIKSLKLAMEPAAITNYKESAIFVVPSFVNGKLRRNPYVNDALKQRQQEETRAPAAAAVPATITVTPAAIVAGPAPQQMPAVAVSVSTASQTQAVSKPPLPPGPPPTYAQAAAKPR